MDTKKYERLLTIVMTELEHAEIEKRWLKHENKRLKDELEEIKQKQDVKEVMKEIKSKM